jgi:DNA-binding MarR family transcriptional regulator
MARISREALLTWRAFVEAHASVFREVDAALASAELPPATWYDVLWPLYRAPKRRLRMNELAAAVVLSRTGLTRLVDRVEAAGLVQREPVPEDRRGTYVKLTPAGARMLRRMWPPYEAVLARRFAPHAIGLRRALEAIARRHDEVDSARVR